MSEAINIGNGRVGELTMPMPKDFCSQSLAKLTHWHDLLARSAQVLTLAFSKIIKQFNGHIKQILTQLDRNLLGQHADEFDSHPADI